ncbi:hypothetical protein EF912_08820 [Streptomyces sp. WAC07061]|uniref:hypothetical protein n=1 Tax=Streptomyces sp. WAC07061 TaxID=2487410 RepID=UPI000F79FD38|nr:hypothetical protein [Streptomyces sp. WAC07061]RSS60776.1 hypothetical protein EF912_08820 [Streptomyces sp. WAC07061]
MTWSPQPPTAAAPPSAGRSRVPAVIAAALFVPALVAAKILVLMTEKGGRCLMYGGCAPFPGAVFLVLCGAAALAMLLALAAPPRLRGPALAAQLVLEPSAVALVLAFP